jgi:membrane fusion protein (multidrug efflux system)
VAQAETQVRVKTARIRTLETDKRTQSAKIRQQEADLAAAEADLERAAKDVKRFGRLAAEGAISTQARDAAESTYKQAAAQRAKYRSSCRESESQLASLEAQIGETRARLQAAQ